MNPETKWVIKHLIPKLPDTDAVIDYVANEPIELSHDKALTQYYVIKALGENFPKKSMFLDLINDLEPENGDILPVLVYIKRVAGLVQYHETKKIIEVDDNF